MTMKPVQMADGGALRWVSGLPMWEGGTHYQGQVFDFLGNLDAVKESLTAQITEGAHRPPLIMEHTGTGYVSGAAVDWRILTKQEAAAMGIVQQAPVEMYLGVDMSADPVAAAAYDEGRLMFTSPDLRGTIVNGAPYVDETGHEWDLFVGEISAVAKPHNKRQTAAPKLRGLDMRKVKMSDGMVVEIEDGAEVPEGGELMADPVPAATPDPLAAIMAELQAMKAEMAAMKAPAAPMADPAGAVSPPAVVEPPAPIAMADAIAAYRAAEKRVDVVMGEKNLGTMTRDRLVEMALHEPARFADMAAIAPARAVVPTGNRSAKPGAAVKMTDSEQVVAMREQCRDKTTGKIDRDKMWAAYEQARKGVTYTIRATQQVNA